MWNSIKLIFGLGGLLLTLAIVAGFFSSLHPALDSISNLRWHLSVALVMLSLIYLLSGRIKFFLIAAIVAIAGIFKTIPIIIQPDTKATGIEISVLQFNLLTTNKDKKSVIEFLVEQDRDIMLLEETSAHWIPFLDQISNTWPNQLFCPNFTRDGGVMILSKYIFTDDRQFCQDDGTFGSGVLDVDGNDVGVGVVHLNWPWPWKGPKQAAQIADNLSDLPETLIIAGDFNNASWSHAVNQVANSGGLTINKSIWGSWIYEGLPMIAAPYLGLRIDHFMHRGNLTLKNLSWLPAQGSDHLPQLAEFVIPDAVDDLESDEAKDKQEN